MNEISDEQTTVVAVMDQSEIVKTGENLDLTAATPVQLAECQHSLVDWVRNKIQQVKLETTSLEAEMTELKTATDHAAKRKWQTSTLAKQTGLAGKRVVFSKKRVEYYEKILGALEAGYYVVPPLGMELFAIRTDKKKPSAKFMYLKEERHGNFEQGCKVLPCGEGVYQNPHPVVYREWEKHFKDEKTGVEKWQYHADHWDAIDFPFTMAKPQIMQATDRAMAIKVFDELGVLPADYRRNPDPVILGRIYQPKKHPYDNKCITFMIAWHLNTKDL